LWRAKKRGSLRILRYSGRKGGDRALKLEKREKNTRDFQVGYIDDLRSKKDNKNFGEGKKGLVELGGVGGPN